MSQRSMVEFNHDLGNQIEANPEAFVAVVLEMIRTGSTPDVVSKLERFGATHVGQRHHSDRVSVEYPYQKVAL